jgi:hypothetical protein
VLRQVGPVLLGEDAGDECQPVSGTLEQEDQRDIGSAEATSAVHDGLEYGVEIRGGATKGGEHPTRRRLLLPDFGKVATDLLNLVAYPPRSPAALDHIASSERHGDLKSGPR